MTEKGIPNKKNPRFKKLSKYLENFIKQNEEYLETLDTKDDYKAGEVAGCINTSRDILNYIKAGRFVDLDVVDALQNGKWINKEISNDSID